MHRHTDTCPSRPPGAAAGPPRNRQPVRELESHPGCGAGANTVLLHTAMRVSPGPWGPTSGPPPPSARTIFQVLTPTQKPPVLLTLHSIRVVIFPPEILVYCGFSLRRLGFYSPVGTHTGGFSYVEPTPAFQRQTPLNNPVIYFLYTTRLDVRIFLIFFVHFHDDIGLYNL